MYLRAYIVVSSQPFSLSLSLFATYVSSFLCVRSGVARGTRERERDIDPQRTFRISGVALRDWIEGPIDRTLRCSFCKLRGGGEDSFLTDARGH